MNDRISLVLQLFPRSCIQAELFGGQITNDDVKPAILDPLFIPYTSALTSLTQSSDTVFLTFGADQANDLPYTVHPQRQQVAQNESPEESSCTGQEHSQLLRRKVCG